MTDLTEWLLSIAWPFVKRIFAGMGVGWGTYEGLNTIASTIRDEVVAAWGMLGDTVLQILSLGGIPQAVGIVLSAYVAKAALNALGKLMKIVS